MAETAKTAREFYVYELRDSRTWLTFYVGKGSGDRMLAHEKSARRGEHSRKARFIRAILADGGCVLAEQVEWFEDEAEAYAAEKERIAAYGLQNLTNIVAGGLLSPEAIAAIKARQDSSRDRLKALQKQRIRKELQTPAWRARIEWLNKHDGVLIERNGKQLLTIAGLRESLNVLAASLN